MKDKTHPSAVSLDGFISKYLKPIDFRDLLKNTFSIILTPKELGTSLYIYIYIYICIY